MKQHHNITIREAYKDYTPPVPAAEIVDRLLSGLPPKRLIGLKTVVLTNAAGLSHDERRAKTWSRKRKVRIRECRGLYHQEWKNEPAWIELFVDSILQIWPRATLRIPLLRDLAFSDVLFHELGHHIHKTQAPEYKEREDVAEDWERRLDRYYYRRKYWYLAPLFLVLWVIVRICRVVGRAVKKARRHDPIR